MSESPERKVLKNTIEKLKAKNITSLNNYKNDMSAFQGTIVNFYKSLNEMTEKVTNKEDKERIGAVLMLLGAIADGIHKVSKSATDTIDNLQLYIDVLESYSVELDATLSMILEKARKYAEEKIKEQDELMKKGETSYIK
jgi:hypothetical protein